MREGGAAAAVAERVEVEEIRRLFRRSRLVEVDKPTKLDKIGAWQVTFGEIVDLFVSLHKKEYRATMTGEQATKYTDPVTPVKDIEILLLVEVEDDQIL